jgi:hypothetical protein
MQEYDSNICTNDFYGFSSKPMDPYPRNLINDDPASQTGTLHYDANDSPVLLFHAKETDSSTGATWTANVLPTSKSHSGIRQ